MQENMKRKTEFEAGSDLACGLTERMPWHFNDFIQDSNCGEYLVTFEEKDTFEGYCDLTIQDSLTGAEISGIAKTQSLLDLQLPSRAKKWCLIEVL